MKNQIDFSLTTYSWLLKKLNDCDFCFRQISEINKVDEIQKIVYLRHDIDLHISMVKELAQLESALKISAIYYVPLTLHFNVLYPENRQTLRHLIELGHKIGLHYDLETYPGDYIKARKHLDLEVDILSQIVGQSVKTITMHAPYKGQPDPFRMIDEYVNPHDPRYQKDLLYVSDSCRAWRDESLLACFSSNPPRRLLLTIHPELWLDGTIEDRMTYLNEVLIEKGTCQHRNYFDKDVRKVWLTHPAPRLHDEREKKNRAIVDSHNLPHA